MTDEPSAESSASGKPIRAAARHVLEEGVVPAAALGAALNDVPRHHGAGDGVEVVVGPTERVQRRPDDQ